MPLSPNHVIVISMLIFYGLSAKSTFANSESETADVNLAPISSAEELATAISSSPHGSTITFDPSLSGETIDVTGFNLSISRNLILNGSTLSKPATLTTSDDLPLVTVCEGTIVTLRGITFTRSNIGSTSLVHNEGNLTLDSVTVTSGTAASGGGVFHEKGILRARNSTFSRNTADSRGGGIFAQDGEVFLTQCTFSENLARASGSALHLSADCAGTITQCTIAGNSDADEDGAAVSSSGASLSVSNSVISGNSQHNINGSFIDLGQNLISGDLTFSPLTENGGSAETMFPTPNSPALDRINTNPKLNSITPTGGHLDRGFLVSPDGLYVVHWLKKEGTDTKDVYTAPTDGSAPSVQLSAPLTDGDEISSVQISPDSKYVTYITEGETEGIYGLYSAPIDGSVTAAKIVDAITNADFFYGVPPTLITPNSSHVIYRSTEEHYALFNLYSVSIDGSSTPVKLNAPVFTNRGVGQYQISPDGTLAVYQASINRRGGNSATLSELYSGPVDGSAPSIKLNNSLDSRTDVRYFRISPNGESVVYTVQQEDDFRVTELYSIPIDGSSSPIKLATFPTSGVNADRIFQICPNSSRVIFFAKVEGSSFFELYSIPVDGSLPAVKLNRSLVSGRFISSFNYEISPDGSRVIYLADHDTEDVYELYSSPIDGSAPPIRLHKPSIPEGDFFVLQFEFRPRYQFNSSGSHIVYLADHETDQVFELYSAPIDQEEREVKISGPLVSGRYISHDFLISPDGSRIVYSADQEIERERELYSAPIDGSSPTIKLNAPLVPGGWVGNSIISPDSSRVVYLVFQGLDAARELYSASIDGSSPTVKLNRPLESGKSLDHNYRISQDGSRVVYLSDQDTADTTELYSYLLLSSDQRGYPRLFGDKTDIGAVESHGAGDLVNILADFNGDLDGDGVPNGLEAAIGTSAIQADYDHLNHLKISSSPSGELTANFGYSPLTSNSIRLKLTRSTDLIDFEDTVVDSILDPSFKLSSTEVSVELRSAPSGEKSFYRLEASPITSDDVE